MRQLEKWYLPPLYRHVMCKLISWLAYQLHIFYSVFFLLLVCLVYVTGDIKVGPVHLYLGNLRRGRSEGLAESMAQASLVLAWILDPCPSELISIAWLFAWAVRDYSFWNLESLTRNHEGSSPSIPKKGPFDSLSSGFMSTCSYVSHRIWGACLKSRVSRLRLPPI